ncbi:hypothetical protein GBAR_LOCUS3135 [Geodia barretti]|uniref:Uncharacterized protein n=1 Tax=Geodia barretti TaxID=519541 RepID=A0AA35R2Y9_GEOBA|nr:hypothetical protein GBAR_LOCUS3135 [Geodia barretti]
MGSHLIMVMRFAGFTLFTSKNNVRRKCLMSSPYPYLSDLSKTSTTECLTKTMVHLDYWTDYMARTSCFVRVRNLRDTGSCWG